MKTTHIHQTEIRIPSRNHRKSTLVLNYRLPRAAALACSPHFPDRSARTTPPNSSKPCTFDKLWRHATLYKDDTNPYPRGVQTPRPLSGAILGRRCRSRQPERLGRPPLALRLRCQTLRKETRSPRRLPKQRRLQRPLRWSRRCLPPLETQVMAQHHRGKNQTADRPNMTGWNPPTPSPPSSARRFSTSSASTAPPA